LIADASIAELLAMVETGVVRVGTSTPSSLVAALVNSGGTVTEIETNLLEVRGLPPERIGALAVEHRIVLSELSVRRASLEEAYMRLTRPLVDYAAAAGRTA
jgi:ABC-2 type transport system ATP-binding protein